MTSLSAAAALFLLIHLLVSGTRLRDAIVGAIGEQPYRGVFSLTSLGAIVWMSLAYNGAVTGADNIVYWVAPLGLVHAGSLVILIAALFVVIGLTTPNPTMAGMEDRARQDDAVRGMVRVTRHPFLWGVTIWALFHLAVNGDLASQIFFGTFALLALAGTRAIDAKRMRAAPEAYGRFKSQTSNLPFAAIMAGRTNFKLGEIGWWRPVAAVAVWAALLAAHPWIFGVMPLPAG